MVVWDWAGHSLKLGPSAKTGDQKMVALRVGDELFIRRKKKKQLNDVIIHCFVLNSIAALSTP